MVERVAADDGHHHPGGNEPAETSDQGSSQEGVGLATTEAYCRRCECPREVVKTVPWQDDLCRQCGATIEP